MSSPHEKAQRVLLACSKNTDSLEGATLRKSVLVILKACEMPGRGLKDAARHVLLTTHDKTVPGTEKS